MAQNMPVREQSSSGYPSLVSIPAQPSTFFDDVGGEPVFTAIAERFYELVAADEVLAPMYPEEDLGPAQERLRLFLMQYWGGPATYSEQRGHPRLRMRHMPYDVGPIARDRWLTCMSDAIRSVKMSPLHEATFLDYVERAAHAMVNTFEEGT